MSMLVSQSTKHLACDDSTGHWPFSASRQYLLSAFVQPGFVHQTWWLGSGKEMLPTDDAGPGLLQCKHQT